MIKVGIECESIEDESWGVGRIINKLLEEISRRPELKQQFKFFLYFKSHIPDHEYLKNNIFVKKIISVPFLPKSFSLYYYILLPIKLWFDPPAGGLDVMFFPNYMLPIIFKGKSIVLLTEDVYYEARGNLPFQYRLAYHIFPVWAAKHATKIMAISETSKKNVAKLFKIPENKIFVNQLAVDSPKPEIAITNYQFPITNYVLYVGQAFPRRHLRETILAFEKLAPKLPDLNLITIGADKYNPPIIKELIERVNKHLGREGIVRKDYVEDVELQELYRNARCLIYVSSREAFGLPPLEALACGTVPIVADNELNHEIYGQNAFFVSESDSVDSIVSAINDCLTNENKRKSILENAPTILSKYTWAAHTDRFLKLIREVAHR